MSVCPSFLNWPALFAACALVGVDSPPVEPNLEGIQFVVLGDMPYSQQEAKALRTDLKAAIAAADVPFVIHYGDFKAGNESCTNELFEQTKLDLMTLHNQVVYTPGDNDWTDCDRSGLRQPQSELERLDKLRTLFFDQASSNLVTRQENYPENARWWQNQVLFTTLHVVGTNNGRKQILKDDPQTAIARVEAREQANQVWLATAFAEARRKKAQSLVVVMQADISEAQGQACTQDNAVKCDAYADLREQLKTEAAQFTRADQTLKPVLLVHGDTFPFCWDKQFGGEVAPNLWRLNAWGDFQQPADVTAIAFRPDQPNNPFEAQTLVSQVIPENCAS